MRCGVETRITISSEDFLTMTNFSLEKYNISNPKM